MKKTLFIVAGIAILLLAIGTWIYLFMYGTPESTEEIFANFGIGGSDTLAPNNELPPLGTTAFNNVIEERTFQQLTTRPVAGMAFLGTTTVRYVEQGTGYIFDIDLETGRETSVVSNTFTKVREAFFSEDGATVLFTRDEDRTERFTVGTITGNPGSASLFTFNLAAGATNAGFIGTKLRYLYETPSGNEVHEYNLVTKTDTVLYTIPLRDVRMIWKDKTYVYTKPTAYLLGYAYEVRGGALSFITEGDFGLMATYYPQGLVTTISNGADLFSTANSTTGDSKLLPTEVFPEKCVSATFAPTEIVCAIPDTLSATYTYPDDWYKGVVSFADTFWLLDLEEGSALQIANPLAETGREVDVLRMDVNTDGTNFTFINKTDNTLWLFDISDDSEAVTEEDTPLE